MKIHPDGWPYIAFAAATNALIVVLAGWAGWLFVPITLWCVAFFRDPERSTPAGDGLILSPADGRLLPIVEAIPPEELGLGPARRTRLSIFMNIFNVHVNRIPADGKIGALAYRPGRFINASFDKASEDNERMAIGLQLANGQTLAVVQIAGLIARRIRCDLRPDQAVRKGERFGIIRFGSRLDVYLPSGSSVEAAEGQKVKAGETILARLAETANDG